MILSQTNIFTSIFFSYKNWIVPALLKSNFLKIVDSTYKNYLELSYFQVVQVTDNFLKFI